MRAFRLDARIVLPFLALTALTSAIFFLQPRTMSYFGVSLLFAFVLPIALATVGQMFIIAVNEIDLSVGGFISFLTAVSVTWLQPQPLLALAAMVGAVAVHALLGALIHYFRVSSIVLTLGMSFFWGGCALLLRPLPGGEAPKWLVDFVQLQVPFVPFPVLSCIVVAVAVHAFLMRTSIGAVMRGVGGNETAIERAGWSVIGIKVAMFAFSGVFSAMAALALAGLMIASDSDIASSYTLLSIAGVILGGGLFVGGVVSPVGAVLGAATLTIASSFLSFISVPADWQTATQGAILIVALSVRGLTERHEAH